MGSDQAVKLVNTRGASLRFDIKKRLGAYVYIGENQQLMFDYINRFRDQGQRDFMVGEGYYKEYALLEPTTSRPEDILQRMP